MFRDGKTNKNSNLWLQEEDVVNVAVSSLSLRKGHVSQGGRVAEPKGRRAGFSAEGSRNLGWPFSCSAWHTGHILRNRPVGSAYWSDDYQGLLFIVFKEINCAHWLFCCCDKTPIPKATWGEKGFICAHSPLQPIVKRSQGRPVRQGSAGRNSGRPWGVLLTGLLPRLMLLSHTSQGHLHRGGANHRELDLSYQSLIMKMSHWHAFGLVLQVPPSVILACVRLIWQTSTSTQI